MVANRDEWTSESDHHHWNYGIWKKYDPGEASDILSAAGVIHAAIDLDSLSVAQLPEELAPDISHRNRASVWFNYRAAGVARLLIAEAVESKAVLDRILEAIPSAEIVICRRRS